MLRLLIIIALLIPIMVIAAPNDATGEAQSAAELTAQALKLAHTPEVLALIEESSVQRIKEDAKLTQKEAEHLKALFLKAMDSQRELANIADALQKKCDTESLQAFNTAYASPVAVKLNEMSLHSVEPTEREKLKAYAASFEKNPPNPQRVQLILHLDEVTESSKILAEFMLATTARMARIESGNERYQNVAEKIKEQAREENLVLMLFGYREASDEELASFVSLHDNPQVAKVVVVLTRETMGSIQNMIDRMMESAVLEAPKALATPPIQS